jgi:hypothetical protein
LDAGALIALENGKWRMQSLVRVLLEEDGRFHVPAGALAQAWRNPDRQVVLTRFVHTTAVHVIPLTELLAKACGELCGRRGHADIVDASVVIVAQRRDDVIYTSDPRDIRRLNPGARIEFV